MSRDPHSVSGEPQFRPPPLSSNEPRPCAEPDRRGPEERLRDSVVGEAHLGGDDRAVRRDWQEASRRGSTPAGNLAAALAAGVVGGMFAVAGAFVVRAVIPHESWAGWTNVVLFGPVAEEMLKAAGALWLLEKRPWRLHSGRELCGVMVLSAVVFAVLENLLYVHVYVDTGSLADPEGYVRFRWLVPSAMHLACSWVASLGLRRMFAVQVRTGARADLDLAFPYFATAMAVHGLYNLAALILDDRLFPLKG